MRPWTGEAATLADRVAAFVRTSLTAEPSEPFETLALDTHAWQVARDPVLASLVEGPVRSWLDIPAVPVALFKDLPVGTLGRDESAVVFRTSGTTGSGRGAHRMRSTALYDLGALAWARRVFPDAPTRVAALLEDPALTPDSSLSHMVGLFGQCTWHLVDGRLDREGLNAQVAAATRPLYLASTAFALAEWLEGEVARPPGGSLLMVTGGLKGRTHRLEGQALYAEARRRLGARMVLEYGMTELSSQLWAQQGQPYVPPPWLRVVAVDPLTAAPVPPEQPGQLRFVDLCNLDCTLAIETMDEGIVHADGRVTLFGRLQGAPTRGCSLTVEEAWARRGER